jgi:hypothetical protein
MGLIVQADGITQDPNVFNFLPLASANRNQLKVHGMNAWDAIKAFVQFGDPPSDLAGVDRAGRSCRTGFVHFGQLPVLPRYGDVDYGPDQIYTAAQPGHDRRGR